MIFERFNLIADRVIGQQNVKKPSVELEAKPAKICSTLSFAENRSDCSRTAVELLPGCA
jgi:hypothetical protein